MFRDRDHAARLLVDRLSALRGRRPLVLGIPRGAVAMARTLAQGLGGDLDVVLVRKIGAPHQPEFAIGAADETGTVRLEPEAGRIARDATWLRDESDRVIAELRARRARYTPARPPIDPAGRVVVVVDDGVATGATMLAALHLLRARHPERLIAAAAVASPEAVARLERAADQVACLEVRDDLEAVSVWFESFPQVSDGEVEEILRESARRVEDAGAPGEPRDRPDASEGEPPDEPG